MCLIFLTVDQTLPRTQVKTSTPRTPTPSQIHWYITMRIFFILLYCGIVLTDFDVSDKLKGRLAMLENQEVPQYWSCPSPALTHGAGYQFFPPEYVPQLDLCWNLNQEKAKKNLMTHFRIHDCGRNGSVCMESNHPNWRSFFVRENYRGFVNTIELEYNQLENLSNSSDFHHSIFCETPNKELFLSCKIRSKRWDLMVDDNLPILLHLFRFLGEWFMMEQFTLHIQRCLGQNMPFPDARFLTCRNLLSTYKTLRLADSGLLRGTVSISVLLHLPLGRSGGLFPPKLSISGDELLGKVRTDLIFYSFWNKEQLQGTLSSRDRGQDININNKLREVKYESFIWSIIDEGNCLQRDASTVSKRIALVKEVLGMMKELSIEVAYTKENIETIAHGRTQTFK